MRILVLSLVVASQLATQPALAARPDLDAHTQFGMFAGAQVKVPLGGREARAEAPRALLGIVPIARSHGFDGPGQMRIGDGLQLRLTPDRPAEVTFAGTRLDRFGLAPRGQAPDGQRSGVSTLGWVAIGVGTLVVLAGGFAIWFEEAMECDPGEC